ncbi:MAG: dihydropteroate synthase [Chloroflexi bacterium]|nr:dihydropteroate synthase [Chloroflexota bacterium]
MPEVASHKALALGAYRLPLDRTLIMGVLNITPDSFSDGGAYLDPHTAIEHAKRLVDEGADIIDVGGESTRPGADAVSIEEELRRVEPAIAAVATELGVPVSIDTRKPEVAARCIEAGASMINDVTGLRNDGMLEVVERTSAAVTIMHMKGTPQTMAAEAVYDNLIGEVREFLLEQAAKAVRAGAQTVIVDPGLGFAKNGQHNLTILNNLNAFTDLGYPLLVGPSRKRFIGELTGAPADDRIPGTIAAVVKCVLAGVPIVRVHDVAACRQAITVTEAIQRS